MDDPALEVLHPFPFRRIALRMPVVALAHPEEVRRETDFIAGVGARGLDRPAVVLARPAGRGNPVAVANVTAEVVLCDDFAHVGEDLGCGRDRRTGPGLEAVAERIEVAVRPDAGIAVRQPGPAEAFLRFEDDEARVGALLGEVVGAADAGDSGADDQHVEMLGLLRNGYRHQGGIGHWLDSFVGLSGCRLSVFGLVGHRH